MFWAVLWDVVAIALVGGIAGYVAIVVTAALLTCRIVGHAPPKPWEAPRATYTRRRVLGEQDGVVYTRTQYRCRRCGKWYDAGEVNVAPKV